MTRYRTIEILLHIIVWCLFFLFPLLFIDRNNPDFSWKELVHHWVVPLVFIIVFYTNYFLLIPRLLFNDRVRQYILYNVLFICLMGVFLYLWQSMAFQPPTPRPDHPRPPRPWIFFIRDILGMAFTVGVSAIIRISKRWSRVEYARKEAEKSRAEAELKNLRNQLNPHFLLNTLNNIYALTAFDSEKAQQAIQELSKLLRYMLYDNQQDYVSLGKEVEFIQNYIELMRIRLASNINVRTMITIDKDNRTPIAPLIFISLIENAFKHGISPEKPCSVLIFLSEEDGTVFCEITNSNFPKTSADKSGSGIGLVQVQKRLELTYPGKYTWDKGVTEDGTEYFSRLIINTEI